MTLVVGLGNPTPRYLLNRHNIGFMVVDKYISHLNPTPINKRRFQAELYKVKDTLFLKPHTFMNNSGLSVVSVVNYFDIKRVIVIHDDLDIPFGTIRIKHGGGNGGHNGLRSIDAHIGKEYDRIRIGISKPMDRDKIVDYVLGDFTKEQMKCLPKILEYSCKVLEHLLSHSATETASKFNLKKSICQEGRE